MRKKGLLEGKLAPLGLEVRVLWSQYLSDGTQATLEKYKNKKRELEDEMFIMQQESVRSRSK